MTSSTSSETTSRVRSLGPDDWLDMEVVAAQRPATTTEEAVCADGGRRTRGTYRLDERRAGHLRALLA
jgi:hypothetical protein